MDAAPRQRFRFSFGWLIWRVPFVIPSWVDFSDGTSYENKRGRADICLMHLVLGSTVWWGGGRPAVCAMYFLWGMRNTCECKLVGTHNAAENRHYHRHHVHQRGNRNREFVTCCRSHTKHGAELLGAKLSPPCLVLQPQDDLSKWVVPGSCQRTRHFAFWDPKANVICSASLYRRFTSHDCFCQMGAKACGNVHLQICSNSVTWCNVKDSSLVWQQGGFFHYSTIFTWKFAH